MFCGGLTIIVSRPRYNPVIGVFTQEKPLEITSYETGHDFRRVQGYAYQ